MEKPRHPLRVSCVCRVLSGRLRVFNKALEALKLAEEESYARHLALFFMSELLFVFFSFFLPGQRGQVNSVY